jgi:hypothetical protein
MGTGRPQHNYQNWQNIIPASGITRPSLKAAWFKLMVLTTTGRPGIIIMTRLVN